MTMNITRRAVEVVLEMLPKPGVVGVDYDSGAYWDILGENSSDPSDMAALGNEVNEVLAELGRGNFSVLELTEDGAKQAPDGFGGVYLVK